MKEFTLWKKRIPKKTVNMENTHNFFVKKDNSKMMR